MPPAIAVYVHIPFCPSKCGYCDFNSYAMSGSIVERTVAAIRTEILDSPWKGIPAKTIFFGGGTPTFLTERQICGLVESIFEVHPPVEDCEITSEANPGTVDAAKFGAMRKSGFNRISIGAQSFRDDDLIRLDRVHKADEIGRAVAVAREAGFANLNLDLMFALPHQTLARWRANLAQAIALDPEHLSLYCLTMEPGTPFAKAFHKGALHQPDDEDQTAMYEECMATMAAAGYDHYEISNFAKPGYACRHNLAYWRGDRYAGYGPGAVGCMDGANVGLESSVPVRYTNWKHPDRYADAVESGACVAFEHELLGPDALRLERIMLGLRLSEGIELEAAEHMGNGVGTILERGWGEMEQGRLRLTPAGRHFCTEAVLLLA